MWKAYSLEKIIYFQTIFYGEIVRREIKWRISTKRKTKVYSIIKIKVTFSYSETLNNEYIERIHQMSYSSLSDNGILQILSFLIKWLYGTL